MQGHFTWGAQKMPTIFPMMSCAAVACHTPRQTSQLHIMPRTSVVPHGALVCARAPDRFRVWRLWFLLGWPVF